MGWPPMCSLTRFILKGSVKTGGSLLLLHIFFLSFWQSGLGICACLPCHGSGFLLSGRVCWTYSNCSRLLQLIPDNILRGSSKPEVIVGSGSPCVQNDFLVLAPLIMAWAEIWHYMKYFITFYITLLSETGSVDSDHWTRRVHHFRHSGKHLELTSPMSDSWNSSKKLRATHREPLQNTTTCY